MPALIAGAAAPGFTLETMDGGEFSLKEALAREPVVLAFFKISCPVCQYTFPFLERTYKACAGRNVSIVGISQDQKRETAAFLKEYGVTFPVLLEDTSRYPVSNAYGLTIVPTIFWIASHGEVEISSVGWVREEIEAIHRKASAAAGAAPPPLFQAGDDVRDFRPG